MAKKRNTQYDTRSIRWDDEDMQRRVEERHRKIARTRIRKRAMTLVLVIAVFVMIGTLFGKDIVRLKAENRALKKQQIALEQQRDALQEELKNTNNQEYIREQAKKQLNLLNPGEILFTFDEEEAKDEAGKSEKDEKADASEKSDKSDKDKDGGSDG